MVSPGEAALPTRDRGAELAAMRIALASARASAMDAMQRSAVAEQLLDELMIEAQSATPAQGAGISEMSQRTAAGIIPRWHFPMLNDHERNDAFAVALERQVVEGSHVLDIGTGTGLLAMMAVTAGAGHVTTCETNPLLAEIARQTIELNGMSEMITVVGKRSTDLVVGRDLDAADLVVSEIVDCGLIGEGILPTIRHAREQLLRPGGRLIPSGGRLYGFLVESRAAIGLNRASYAGGYDVRLLNMVSTPGHFPIRLSTWPHQVVSDTVELLSFDFAEGPLADGQRLIRFPTNVDATAQAFVAWFELDLGSGVAIRNSPDNLGSHWMQAFIPFDEPVPVQAGQGLDIAFAWSGTTLSACPQ